MEKDEEILKSVNRIERGLYGDPDNKVEGVIDKVDRHDKILAIPTFIQKNPGWAFPILLLALFTVFEIGHRGVGWLIAIISK